MRSKIIFTASIIGQAVILSFFFWVLLCPLPLLLQAIAEDGVSINIGRK